MTSPRIFAISAGRKPNQGFSLVELMVALAAGLIVSSAVVAFMMSSFKSNGEYVLSTKLTQELRNSLDLVTRDVRRAGYNENAMSTMASGTSSPFSPILVSGECIIYAYDRIGGTPGTIDIDRGEVRAIRRVDNGSGIGVIEYAESSDSKPTCGGATADYSQYPPACNATTHWCALSDPAILDITALTFTDNRVDIGTQISMRDIGVAISGQLANSTQFPPRTVSSSVRIRSDCFMPTVAFNCAASP